MAELPSASTVASDQSVDRIEPESLAERLRESPDGFVILDVRRRESWSVDPTRLPRATWLPLEALPRHARELPREAHLIVYCA